MKQEQLEIWDNTQIPAAQHTFFVRWNQNQQEVNSHYMEAYRNRLDTSKESGLNRVMPDSGRKEGESFPDYANRLRQQREVAEASAMQSPTAPETNEPSRSPDPSRKRRKFLKAAGTILGFAILGGALDKGFHAATGMPYGEAQASATTGPDNTPNPTTGPETPGATSSPEPTQSGETHAMREHMVLSDNERVFTEEVIGYLSWSPDGPITYWTTKEGKRRYLFTGGQDNGTYLIETDGVETLKDIMGSGKIDQNSFKKVFGPDENVEYRREYAGITGVLQIDKSNPDHLLGVTHNEKRTNRNASGDYTSTVGLVESFDSGLTWQDKGPLITGTDVKEPGGGKVSGAGQPTVILNEDDGYAYIMYIDWSAASKHEDQLYMARAKANDNGSLGQIEYYSEGGFSSNKDNLKSVIPVPEGSDLVYMALPHISWNIELNKYICEGESDTGFWSSSSVDLLNWSNPEIIYDFKNRGGEPHSILKVGQKWDSYPTALSENQPNSQITDKMGIFYHSSGNNISPHEPAALDFTLQ